MFSKNGNADLGIDPMPPNASDTYVIPKPESEWPSDVHSKEDIIRRIAERMKGAIGNRTEIQQPIQMQFNELIAGVRADVAIKLHGDDLEAMNAQATRIAGVVRSIPGASDVSVEQTSGAPTFDVQIDRQAVARLGLSVEEVADTVSAALGGREAGLLFEGDRRFSVMIRLPDAQRDDIDALGAIPIMLPTVEGQTARSVPLSEIVRFRYAEGLNQISRENGKRMMTVHQRSRARSRWLRRGRPGQDRRDAATHGHVYRLGRHVREPPVGAPATDDRRTDLLPRDLRAALSGVGRVRSRADRLLGSADGAGGRRIRAPSSWYPVLDHRIRRVHRPVGRGGPQRTRDDGRDPQASRGK